jgi:hypothetical protein
MGPVSMEILKKEGLRLVGAMAVGFIAGSVYFSGLGITWPTSSADQAAWAGVFVNTVFGAATAATAFIAYRLGSRDALSRSQEAETKGDVAAGLLFDPAKRVKVCSGEISRIILGDLNGPLGERAAQRMTRYADRIEEALAAVDYGQLPVFAVREKALALQLTDALQKAKLVHGIAKSFSNSLLRGVAPLDEERSRLDVLARETALLTDRFLQHCYTKIGATIDVRDQSAAQAAAPGKG